MLPAEGLSAMGLDVWPHLAGDFLSLVTNAIRGAELRDVEVQSLVGNKIHGASLYIVLLAAFSTTVRLPPTTLRKFPCFLVDCDNDDLS